MAFTENLEQFFDSADFGVSATFTPSAGVPTTTIQGIFDAEYIAVDAGGAVSVAGNSPMFHCKASDAPDPMDATLVVNGTSYTVVEARPDGIGLTMLILEEQ